jgi:hypothetical protein
MAATDAQKLKTRLLLALPLAEVAGPLDALTAPELTELDAILAQAETLKFRAAVVNVDGVSVDPDDQRSLLRQRVYALLGWSDGPYTVTIGRA